MMFHSIREGNRPKPFSTHEKLTQRDTQCLVAQLYCEQFGSACRSVKIQESLGEEVFKFFAIVSNF